MGGNKNQHNGRISSGQTAPPPSQGGVNVQPVNITRPPTYTLTVGFEVNYPTAFDGTTQNLGLEDPPNDKIGDYGHGFFYVTDSGNIIVTAISFGPDARATTKHISGQGRKGTINYRISEVTQLFRLTISERQCNNLKKAVAAFKKQVDNEEVLYDPFWNDTCAARARKVLDEAGIDTPSGEGYVKELAAVLLIVWLVLLRWSFPICGIRILLLNMVQALRLKVQVIWHFQILIIQGILQERFFLLLGIDGLLHLIP